MKCSKCGKDIQEGDKFCRECGQVVSQIKEEVKEVKKENKEPETKGEVILPPSAKTQVTNTSETKDNSTLLCLLSIACYFGGPFISGLLIALSEHVDVFRFVARIPLILPLVAYGLVIYARIKYPNSTFAKVLLIVYIVLFAASIVLLIFVLIACFQMIQNCGQDCSGMGAILQLIFQ